MMAAWSVFLVLCTASPGWAHRVIIFAWVEGQTIHTESKFVPGDTVNAGQVQVLDNKTGRVLLTGQTDDQGRFSFPIPPEAIKERMDLKIVLDAGMGHEAEWLLRAKHYLPEAAASKTPPVKPAAPTPGESSSQPPSSEARGVPGAHPEVLDRQVLEQVVDQALERKLAPIKEMLAASQVHRPSLTDIIGGLGYILGIWGLIAYFKSKRKNTG